MAASAGVLTYALLSPHQRESLRFCQGGQFDVHIQRFPTHLIGRNSFHIENLVEPSLPELRIVGDWYKVFAIPD
jgi:hypothetical protein